MDSMAHQWLREWLDDGGFIGHGHADLWYLGVVNARATRQDFVGFREQMRQLLADAESGRKLREGKA
jgi:hypothetical protein